VGDYKGEFKGFCGLYGKSMKRNKAWQLRGFTQGAYLGKRFPGVGVGSIQKRRCLSVVGPAETSKEAKWLQPAYAEVLSCTDRQIEGTTHYPSLPGYLHIHGF